MTGSAASPLARTDDYEPLSELRFKIWSFSSLDSSLSRRFETWSGALDMVNIPDLQPVAT